MGKRLENKTYSLNQKQVTPIKTLPDRIPSHQELSREAKETAQVSEDALNQGLREEVSRSGIKLDAHHQVTLPTEAKSANAGATNIHESESQYSLLIGSYSNLEEAKKAEAAFKKHELNPSLHEVELKGKGKWFRIVLGEYVSRADAEKAGESYKAKHLIHDFKVNKLIRSEE